MKLDKQFPVEQFEATVSQSSVPFPPSWQLLPLGSLASQDFIIPLRKSCGSSVTITITIIIIIIIVIVIISSKLRRFADLPFSPVTWPTSIAEIRGDDESANTAARTNVKVLAREIP